MNKIFLLLVLVSVYAPLQGAAGSESKTTSAHLTASAAANAPHSAEALKKAHAALKTAAKTFAKLGSSNSKMSKIQTTIGNSTGITPSATTVCNAIAKHFQAMTLFEETVPQRTGKSIKASGKSEYRELVRRFKSFAKQIRSTEHQLKTTDKATSTCTVGFYLDPRLSKANKFYCCMCCGIMCCPHKITENVALHRSNSNGQLAAMVEAEKVVPIAPSIGGGTIGLQ